MKIIRVESKVKEQPPITMARQQVPSLQTQAQSIRQTVKVIKQTDNKDDDE